MLETGNHTPVVCPTLATVVDFFLCRIEENCHHVWIDKERCIVLAHEQAHFVVFVGYKSGAQVTCYDSLQGGGDHRSLWDVIVKHVSKHTETPQKVWDMVTAWGGLPSSVTVARWIMQADAASCWVLSCGLVVAQVLAWATFPQEPPHPWVFTTSQEMGGGHWCTCACKGKGTAGWG